MGLGLVVRSADFQKAGELVHGDDWQGTTAEACFYEVSHVPIWVIAEDLTYEVRCTVKWDAFLILSLRGWNNTKRFIYRANAAPLRDAVRVGDTLLPAQVAQPVRNGAVQLQTFIGKSQMLGQIPRSRIITAISGILSSRCNSKGCSTTN